MGKPSEEVLREIFFSIELEHCLELITSGLAYLQNNELYKKKHFVYLILLSGGIERLAKVILYLRIFETEARYISSSELRGWGHNLEALTDEIIERCFTKPYTEKSFATDDVNFLKNDKHFRRMLQLLSEFAMRDRYIYMDGLVDPSKFKESPEMLWEEFQRDTLTTEESLKSLDEDVVVDHVRKLNRNAIICIEKLLSALARLFVFGVLGAQGNRYASWLREFVVWENDKFGMKEYEF